jgi:shikimate dehydrogenase
VSLLNQQTPTRAEFIPWSGRYAIPADVNIVANAASIGLHPNLDAHLNLDFDTVRPTMVVADIIANPPRSFEPHKTQLTA